MLEVKNLSKIYRPKNGAAVTALNKVNLKLADKGLVFLLGKSGSGKSTLLNLMGGLDTYSGGEIIIKGKSSFNFKQSDFDSYRNTYIGFIFQEFNILEDYTVGRNIGLALELQHKKADRAAVDAILKQVDLDGFFDRRPNELSGGQKQRVAIARALIKNPEIIMGDEPTGSLDSNTGRQVFDTLKNLSKDKLVVIVSHDRENAEVYGDRIIELADGVIINDRIRSEESGELIEQPISYIEEGLIKIEGGYQLSGNDITRINKMLASTKGDVFIAADEGLVSYIATNKNVKAKSGSGGQFVETTEDNYAVKSYKPNDFKLVKSKLPFKDSFKMGASGLKLKKVRLVFTIFLSFFAFTLFGLSTTASAFNPHETNYRTMIDYGAKSVYINMESGYKYSGNNVNWNPYGAEGMSAAQLKEIADITGKPILKVVENKKGYGSDINIDLSAHFDSNQAMPLYYAKQINRLIEVDKASDANLTPAKDAESSVMPQAYDEIAITDFIADTFVKYGYKSNYDSEKKTIANYGELIGKTLKLSNTNLKITGVYKTEYSLSRFADLKDKYKGFAALMKADGMRNMIISMGFVKPGFSDQMQVDDGSANISEFLNITKLYANSDEVSTYWANKFLKIDNALAQDVHWIGGKTQQAFTDDDIIVSSNFIDYYHGSGDINDAIDYFAQNYNLIVKMDLGGVKSLKNIAGVYYNPDYDEDNFSNNFIVNEGLYNSVANKAMELSEARNGVIINGSYGLGDFKSNQLYSWNENSYYKFIPYFQQSDTILWKNGVVKTTLADDEVIINPNYFRNPFGNNNNDITNEQMQSILNSLTDTTCTFGVVSWEEEGYKVSGDKTLKIVGVNTNYRTFISESFYGELLELKNAPLSALVILSGNNSTDRAFMDYVINSERFTGSIGQRITANTIVSPILNMLEGIVPIMKTVFLYVSLAFCLFAALLLMNFIGVSISHKKKDIGVLRAIGARSKDVFMIFLNESFIIGFINIVLSVIAVVALSLILNFLLTVTLLVPGVLQILFMVLLCFGIAFLATFVAVFKISRKKPIDAINNR